MKNWHFGAYITRTYSNCSYLFLYDMFLIIYVHLNVIKESPLNY